MGVSIKDKYCLPFIILAFADYVAWAGSFLLAYFIRFYTPLFELFPPPDPPYIPNFTFYFLLSIVIGLLGVIVYERFGMYSKRVGLDRQVWPGSLVIGTIVTYIFVMALLFNYREIMFSRFTVALAMPITAVSMLALFVALKHIQLALIQRGIIFFKTVLIGPEQRCREFLHKLQEHHGSMYQVMGYISTDGIKNDSIDFPCLGTLETHQAVYQQENISQAIVVMPSDDHQKILSILADCRNVGVTGRVVPELYDDISKKVSIADIDGIPTVHFGEINLVGYGPVIKRSFDIVFSLIALLVASPIMFLIALIIKIDSRGPIFYVQERVGNDGSKFNIYKFRSMVDDAERDSGPRWATANDPRTTPIGRFLRRYNLDELPQFLNVLRGDMSLVGPRPERPYFVDRFKEEIPLYMRRHMVKSGITGLAQVNGWRGDTSVKQRTHYDLYYVQNWSLFMDIKIILKTLVSFKNAY